MKLNSGLKHNQIMKDVVFVRKVVRGSVKKFEYSLNFPREVIEKLDLIGATIKLTIKKDSLIITKNVDEPNEVLEKIHTSKTEVSDDEILI